MRISKYFGAVIKISAAGLAACACALLASCAGFGSSSEYPDNEGFDTLLKSVVKIDVWETSQKDGGSTTNRAVGSGVIIDKNGMVLTNAHVVNRYAVKIIVTLSNLERVKAEFVGWDHWTDLAVIKLDTKDLKNRGLSFTCAQFGDSAKLKAGEVVYAVGTPYGFARTVTRGIISNTDRYFQGTIIDSGYETGLFNTWIQTDAAINPGNSGGPLVLSDGAIVGINTRAAKNSSSLGFAVPSDVAKIVVARLIESGKVDRGYVGITPAPLQEMEKFFDIDANKGVLVQNVDAGSPAAEAGILPGDIMMKIDGVDVDGRFPEQLPAIMNKIASAPAGSEIKFEFQRNGKSFEKTLKCELLESRVGREFTLEKWGAGIREITRVFAREARINCPSNQMVIGVREGFPFDMARIEPGDIIVSVNRKKITNSKELEDAYDAYCKNPQKTLVEVQRDHAVSFHIITPTDK